MPSKRGAASWLASASATAVFRSSSSFAMAASSAAMAAGMSSGRRMPLSPVPGWVSLPMISSTRRPLGCNMMRSPVVLDLNLYSIETHRKLQAMRMLRILIGLTFIAQLSACADARYYLQSVEGHLQIMQAARPIEQWFDDEGVAPALKQRLML